MIEHKIIPPFSTEWFIYNLISLIIIISIIYFGKNSSNKNKKKITIGIATLFIFEFFFMDWYHLFTGLWSVQDSLPLHLCGIMWFISIYMLLTKKQWAFEMVLFIGMPGGLHSLLTPELTHGDSLVHKIDFFIGHGGLILVPFYGIYVLNMWSRKSSWWQSFIRLQILVIIAAVANYLFESNYMYLSHPPIADNPLIPSENSFFGKWPYYIVIFEIAVLIHAILIYFPFWIKKRKTN